MQVLSPTEFSNTEPYLTDAVPTGIAINNDGTVYVSIFGGFPYFKGSGKILQINDGINGNKESSILIANNFKQYMNKMITQSNKVNSMNILLSELCDFVSHVTRRTA